MDLDGRIRVWRPDRHIWNIGYAFGKQYSWGAPRERTWVDKHGDLWLFGGAGYDSNGAQGHLNDLWKYSGGQWTWVSGSNLAYQKINLWDTRCSAAANVPGGRYAETTWTDSSEISGFSEDSAQAMLRINS